MVVQELSLGLPRAAQDAPPWPHMGGRSCVFFILAYGYVFIIAYESISKVKLYKMVWWELRSTVELLYGGATALELRFQSWSPPNRLLLSFCFN